MKRKEVEMVREGAERGRSDKKMERRQVLRNRRTEDNKQIKYAMKYGIRMRKAV